MEVLKFGGSSLVSAQAMVQVRDVLIARRAAQRIVVCSAMGGVTNELIRIGLRAASSDASFRDLVQTLKNRHVLALEELGVPSEHRVWNELPERFIELEALCEGIFLIRELSAKSMDQLVSFGERLAVPMVHAWLEHSGLRMRRVDARDWILTNDQFGSADVNLIETQNRIHRGVTADLDFEILITEGFIGRTETGDTTTLGRGGSDYTASLIANAIDADFLEKSTDVSGMMTADPRMVREAQIIDEMSYEEAMELCHFGAKVIYHPTIAPLREKGIPLIVRSTFESDHPGTRIVAEPDSRVIVRGLSSVDGIALLTMEGGSLIGRPGFSSRIFSALAQAGVNVIFITQSSSENSLTIGIAAADLTAGHDAIAADLEADITLGRIAPIRTDQDLSIIALVGGGMVSAAGVSGTAFKSLGDAGVNIRAIAQGSTERNISIVVNTEDVPQALQALHGAFFTSEDSIVRLFCAGVGQVGQFFLQQMEETSAAFEAAYGGKLLLSGAANSRQFVLDERGIPFSQAVDQLKNAQHMPSIEAAFEAFAALPGARKIWVDNSAAPSVAQLAERAIEQGVAYVASNKIAATGSMQVWNRLMATSSGRRLFRNETNVGAALPVIRTIQGMIDTGDEVLRVEAVLSGSLNFIFSSMDRGKNFEQAVHDAMKAGYTEPDPRLDLNGMDVARKILILARLAGSALELRDVAVDGFLSQSAFEGDLDQFVTNLGSVGATIDAMHELAVSRSQRLRFLATWSSEEGCRCALKPLSIEHPFYSLDGTDNAVSILSNRYSKSPLVIQGAGAGGALTASGVLNDVHDVCRIMVNHSHINA